MKIDEPVVDEQVVLTWINEQRKRMGLHSIRKIRKGRRSSPGNCPVACSLRANTSKVQIKVGTKAFSFRQWRHDWVNEVSLPAPVQWFIVNFDLGKLPKYDELYNT